jgi:hypothetical protein
MLAAIGALAVESQAAQVTMTEPFVGVKHYHRQTTSPRLLDIHIIEVDTQAPGIGFFVTPSNGSAPGETNGQTTRSFLQQYGAEVAINGSFYSDDGSGKNISGISASNGNVYSPFESGRVDALNITNGNVASIIRGIAGGTSHSPATSLYNAVNGRYRIVNNGVVDAFPAGDASFYSALRARTAAGVTADGRLLLMTVDGGDSNHSLGMNFTEVAQTLIQYGAQKAVMLDGGGSTTMAMADPSPRLVNKPEGSERAVGNNLGVFAATQTQPADSGFVFADFEFGDEGFFGRPLNYSSNTKGILNTSVADVVTTVAHTGSYSQRVVIRRDPGITSTPENPDGWFVRHISGEPGSPVPATRAANVPLPTTGQIGFWAFTYATGIEVSMVVDSSADVTGDRGIRLPLIPDGQWHRYAWDLDNNDDWDGWVAGDGAITGSTFTLDSIQIFGQHADATIYIDDVFHEVRPGQAPLPGDFNGDRIVNKDDLIFWNHAHNRHAGGDADADGDTDGADFLAWQRNVGTIVTTVAPVPEPTALAIAGVAAICLMAGRRSSSQRCG